MARGYTFVGPGLAAVAERAAERPGLVQIERIGTSAGERPVWAVHVARPDEPVHEELLVVAGIHALEWISTEVALTWLHELIDAPPRGVSVTVVPVLNPDGRAHAEADLLEGAVERYRRGNALGVDLNRDYAHHRDARAVWKHLIPGYYGTTEAPLSQPVSQALDALMARHDYDRAVSLHAFGGYLYHPWAGAWRRPEGWADYVQTGRAMERAQGGHAYRTRQLSRWGFFFRAHGTELDHFHGEHGAQAWLIELTRSGLRPHRILRDRQTPFRWYNPANPSRHLRRGVAALRVLPRRTDEGEPPG
jgi:hypothetical protein